MTLRLAPCWLPLLLSSSMAAALAGEKPSARGKVDFVRDVRPLFARSCFSCHGPQAQEGGLRLHRKQDALAGGDSGKVIAPGKSAASKLIQYVTGENEDGVRMPPETEGAPLSAEQIALLKRWIDQGALWPAESDPRQKLRSEHWAFRPVTRPGPPAVNNAPWVRNVIDAFVLARLEQESIEPSPQAPRATLLRRVYLDLLGVPPSVEEVTHFLSDRRPGAYERAVDRLLASPHYGERFARHWLDLARYADSDGYEKDRPRPFAWRYRQWVIEALNAGMPFDEFTMQQLAGDLLPKAGVEQKVATGFHRNTLTNREGGTDREEDRVKQTVDRTNTTGTVWLGLTVGCAQCHSHKYDPLSQREYYGLYAFFNSLQEVDVPAPLAGAKKGDKTKAQTLAELSQPRKTRVLIRGDFLRPGDPVDAGAPAFLPKLQSAGQRPTRLDLARWLTNADNPLTARVTVNRAWQQFFGQGLVETSHDFGTQGSPPTHPRLLDHLGDELIRGGWSLKSLHRLIVTSATYRQSSATRGELSRRDPYNKLLARQNRLRVEAEIVRDLALAASGLLSRKIGGPSVRPPQPSGVEKLGYANSVKWALSKGADRYRRGVYTFFQRTVPYPMFMDFDAPDSNVSCTRRERSNTPISALTLQNDPVFVECAQSFARRIVGEHPCGGKPNCTAAGRVKRAFRIALGRQPQGAEAGAMRQLYRTALSYYELNPRPAAAMAGGTSKPEQAGDAELAAWTLVARTLMNLDEFITRE